ncbi:O-methyltransferase [Amnibacterium endophyticum]|uniref:O-methyltransferase n=1 Tax=Amnibacterium endophyticum TaxID=2109337 RepID=A0ABW4LDQ2_9MICO
MAMLYSDRSAKTVQRRMIVDACRRLTAIAPTIEYQYVGFGGLEYNDFIDMHLALGLETMTSIERDTMLTHRVEFNRPYAGIEVKMGEARDMLSTLHWDRRAITWLDYTDPLDRNILRDVDYVIRAAPPGSVTIVTTQADLRGKSAPERLATIRERLDDLCPPDLAPKDTNGWGIAAAEREALQTLANSVCREAHDGPFRQLFNFNYADNARMLTWGGITASPALEEAITRCRFDDLPFIREGAQPLLVRVPDLTTREWLHLERETAGGHALPNVPPGIQAQAVEDFERVYRWR